MGIISKLKGIFYDEVEVDEEEVKKVEHITSTPVKKEESKIEEKPKIEEIKYKPKEKEEPIKVEEKKENNEEYFFLVSKKDRVIKHSVFFTSLLRLKIPIKFYTLKFNFTRTLL